MDLLEYVSGEMDKNKYVITVFVDLQKAFDTVNIDLLLDKLYKMGCRGICYELLKSYSTNRQQYTSVNNSNSETAEVEVGVAQGSVLGPLQYLLYVHSLKYVGLKAKYFMFADDTVLVYSSENQNELQTIINTDLENYFEWLCYNRLSINAEKTVYMVIKQKGKLPCNPVIHINKVVLKEVMEYKYLGLIIQNNLSWNAHVNSIISRVSPMVGAIRRCSHQFNNKVKSLIYNSFIEPHLRYLIPCWGNTTEYLLNKLQRLQNKAVKAVNQLNFYTPSEQLYRDHHILKIKQIKTLEQTKLINSIQKALLKTNVVLKLSKDSHTHNTRTKENMRNEQARTKKNKIPQFTEAHKH